MHPRARRGSKNQSITEGVLEYFSPLVDSCSSEKELNPCLRGDYRGNHCAATALVARQAKGYVGFTEELFYILTASKNVTSEKPNINVISAPLGKGSYPVMFVDALVVSKKCKEDKECFERLQKFIRFMSETKTRELIAFSQDAGKGAVPRYTLQANTDFYEGKLAQEDHYYPKFRGIIDSAAIFPNDVSAAGYKTLSEKVSKSLSSPPK